MSLHRQRLARLLFALIPVVLILLAMSIGGCSSDAQSKDADTPEETTTAVPVEVASVKVGEASAFFSGTASLEAEDEATVVARVGGVVEEIFVEEGTPVQAGQALARLDDERLRLEVERANVELAKLERVYERTQKMYDKQLVSAEQFEQIRSDFETQKVARDLAQMQLEYATVRAPISGVVSTRHIKAGNMIRENDPAFRVTDFDPLRAVMHVPERELNKLREGQMATLQFDALPGEVFSGRVKLISPTVDPETGTFRAIVEVRDPSRQVKPGMFGRVRIQYDQRMGALLIPKQAVLEEDDESAVFVVRDSMAIRRVVTTGYTSDDRIEILDGVAEGERIVITGQATLQDSAKVEVINQ
jgi:membrane fusion protein (multidrug efflux system)